MWITAFVSSTTYLEDDTNKYNDYNLLPVGAVSRHAVRGDVLGYYSDVILRKDTRWFLFN